MFLHALWKTTEFKSSKPLRIRTPYGSADVVLRCESGRGELALLSRVPTNAVVPECYAALGLLLTISSELPKLEGEGTSLKLTPTLHSWQDERVLSVFRRGGFSKAVLSKDTLELQSELPPEEAIERAGVIAFALDSFSRKLGGPELFIKARSSCRGLPNREEILLLLDEVQGQRHLRKLLGKGSSGEATKARDSKIVDALARIRTKRLVCFGCGGGPLLSRLGKSLPLENLLSVETSLKKAARKVYGYELLHGSVLEPPAGLNPESTALVIGALPAPDDLRFGRAAEVLLERIGFEWVLCLATGPQVRALADRGAKCGYRVSEPWTIGTDHAVMLRRIVSGVARVESPLSERLEIEPQLGPTMRIEPRQWAATSEDFSGQTVDPRWMFYLPPHGRSLLSRELIGDLEHPRTIFDYYRNEGITELVAEAVPMASRVVVVVCVDEQAGSVRFGIEALGSIYTRQGKPLFKEPGPTLRSIRDGLSRADFWRKFKTKWACFDGYVLRGGEGVAGHSVRGGKHQAILQFGEALYGAAGPVLERLAPKNAKALLEGRECLNRYRTIYEQSRFQTTVTEPFFVPSQLIATEGKAYFANGNRWQMETLCGIARSAGPPLVEAPFRLISLADETSLVACVSWWEQMCAVGAAGIVIKPLAAVPKGRRGTAQPGFICRGREQLRLVYGPEYDLAENRLMIRDRQEQGHPREKNRMVLKQLYLSIESVRRFLDREPIERIEECVRGAMALEQR